jgi:hypothetical protein
MQKRQDPDWRVEMLATLEAPTRMATAQADVADSKTCEAPGGLDEFGRAVIDSVVNRRGLTLSVEVPSEMEAIETSARLEAFLLPLASFTDGAFARVAPRFLDDTYPAMLALTTRLGGAWCAEGERIIRTGEARLAFVSVDRPLGDPRGVESRPDRLIEVVSAHRIDREWYRSRVMPRARADGLTQAFYGVPEAGDSLFDDIRRTNLALGDRDGVCRHFAWKGF